MNMNQVTVDTFPRDLATAAQVPRSIQFRILSQLGGLPSDDAKQAIATMKIEEISQLILNELAARDQGGTTFGSAPAVQAAPTVQTRTAAMGTPVVRQPQTNADTAVEPAGVGGDGGAILANLQGILDTLKGLSTSLEKLVKQTQETNANTTFVGQQQILTNKVLAIICENNGMSLPDLTDAVQHGIDIEAFKKLASTQIPAAKGKGKG